MLKKSIGSALAIMLCAPLYAAEAVMPAAAPQPMGEMMGNTCAGCHGTMGRVSGEAFMPLAGMKEATFIKAMTDFRSGSRPATLMGHLARGYSDAEIKAMAEYFVKIKP